MESIGKADAINQRFVEAYQAIMKRPDTPSKKEFCERIGISYSNWSKYERGERPFDLISVVDLTNSYGVSSDYILFGKGEMFVNQTNASTMQVPKNLGRVNNTSNSNAAIQPPSLEACQKDLLTAHEKIELLTSQIRDKERIIELLEMQLRK